MICKTDDSIYAKHVPFSIFIFYTLNLICFNMIHIYLLLLRIDFTHEIRHYFYIFTLTLGCLLHKFDANLIFYCSTKSSRANTNRIFRADMCYFDNYNKISFRGNDIHATVISVMLCIIVHALINYSFILANSNIISCMYITMYILKTYLLLINK